MTQLRSPRTIGMIFLLYLSSLHLAFAQQDEIPKGEEVKGHSYITTNVLSSLNGFSPRLRFGYIAKGTERWKMGLDVGYGNENLTFFELGEHYELWEVRPEFYYFLRSKRNTQKYLSLEPFYINHKDVFFDYHYNPVNGGSTRYDQADYQRQKYGVNLKFGFLFHSRNRLGFNLYAGLGFRIRKNAFSNIQNPREVDLGPEGGDFFGIETYKRLEGTNVTPNFSFGLKLYYRLDN